MNMNINMNKFSKISLTTYADVMNWDANRLMAFFLISGMSMGAIINFVSQYIFKKNDLYSVLLFSFFLIFLGLFGNWIVNLKLNEKLTAHLLAVISFFIIPFIVMYFQDIGGGSIWAVCFLFITGSLIFSNHMLFIYISISTILTQILLWIKLPQVTVVLNTSTYVVRIGLLLIIVFIGYFVNKTYLKKLEENLVQINTIEQLAYYDYLTGLPNRILFADQLNRAILQAKDSGKCLAVLFLDLDAFKIINDTMGHEAGDQMLKELSKRLLDVMYSGDTVCRFGGDEFIILANNLSKADDANRIAEKILAVFDKPFILHEHECYITASLGIALYPHDGESIGLLIKNADMAMYKAKSKARNQYEICTPLMKISMAEDAEIYNNLHHALENNELMLYYQPQVSNCSGKIIGVEALLRWNHPELGLITPDKFIPIAERTGLISVIGEWVIRQACLQIKQWQIDGLPCIRMALNLSIQQLYNPQIVDQVAEILDEIDLDASCLEMEVTESIAMQDTDYIVEILRSLQELGITISIDDFGIEYSSLKYLKHLPVDRLKIAIPFIQGIGISDKDEAITIAIIHLAKSLGLSIIAEGVENKEQLDFLSQRMCDEIQGFYYHKPMPAHEIENLLRSTLEPSTLVEIC